jgi:hypothetical protein
MAGAAVTVEAVEEEAAGVIAAVGDDGDGLKEEAVAGGHRLPRCRRCARCCLRWRCFVIGSASWWQDRHATCGGCVNTADDGGEEEKDAPTVK